MSLFDGVVFRPVGNVLRTEIDNIADTRLPVNFLDKLICFFLGLTLGILPRCKVDFGRFLLCESLDVLGWSSWKSSRQRHEGHGPGVVSDNCVAGIAREGRARPPPDQRRGHRVRELLPRRQVKPMQARRGETRRGPLQRPNRS